MAKKRGKIVTINQERGFGFIRPDDAGGKRDQDLFFHATGMADRAKFADAQINDAVEFEVETASDNRKRAVQVACV